MIGSDEYLERVVAGIQAVTTHGAEVNWNEIINGRQFDVVVRFKLGSLRYLIVIEVKNRSRKAEVADLDAFVTKARDQNANKSVFVTAAGFQDGAKTVAIRHGIDLFTVTFDDAIPTLPRDGALILLSKLGANASESPSVTFGEPTPVNIVERAALIYEDGKKVELPTEPSQMAYYCQKTMLSDGRSIAGVFENAGFGGTISLDQSQQLTVRINPPQAVEPPDTYCFPKGTITAIEAKISARMGLPMHGNAMMDPGVVSLPVVYTNAVTGEEMRYYIGELPLGVKRVTVGKFYFSYHPLKYYYCDRISGHLVHWDLIESFQNGELVSATFTQDIKWSPSFIPVSNKVILNRLQRRLEDYRRRSGKRC